MLNKTSPRLPGEAKVRYLDSDCQVISPGDFVLCAVTGKQIPLQALRYWSVERQEAYYDAEAAGKAMAGEKYGAKA